MLRAFFQFSTFLATILIAGATVRTAEIDRPIWLVFDDAEQAFQPPDEQWFSDTQQALREEAARVSRALNEQGEDYASAWKSHLRWNLLERNLGSISAVNAEEVQIVRRWLYSNREGLEGPFFAELRRRVDNYADAVFTFSHDDLYATFLENVELARGQCRLLTEKPVDANAAALGRTLGWFETTRQLEEQVAKVRSLTSFPNAQIVISEALLKRVVGNSGTDIDETVPVSDRVTMPNSRLFGRPRTIDITGTARTNGSISLVTVPNSEIAELSLLYDGLVHSLCQADAGPVVVHTKTEGDAQAAKPIYFGYDGLEVGETSVNPQVQTHVRSISARSEVLQRIARRQVNQPETQAFRESSSRSAAVRMLRERLDKQVESALDALRKEIEQTRESLGRFSELTAPLVREGAVPYFAGARSTQSGIELNTYACRREQFGSATLCPDNLVDADLQVRVHVSFFNNMAETILGGKTLTDTFLMRYAKILQAQLPLPLMVHSRSKRWAITTEKHRPLELQITGHNEFQFIFRLTALEVDGVQVSGPTKATVVYHPVENEFGEIIMQRQGELQLETQLAAQERDFLQEKLAAFFAPVLDGGGVMIPDGGTLGIVRKLQPQGFVAENEWMIAGVNVPTEVLQELLGNWPALAP